MLRTRLAAPVALGCVALAAAGVAAAGHRRTQSTQQAAATFAAGTVTHSRTSSCTASDGTYEETTATYDGTASSGDPHLNGALTIRAHSVVDTTTGLGWVEGSFRIRGSGAGAHGRVQAALAGGSATGTVVGDATGPSGKLVATLAAAFAPGSGFSSGSLGSGSAAGAGVVFRRGACTNVKHTRSVLVSHLAFSTHAVVPAVSGKGKASGSLTLDLTRDSTGAVTGATAVFYVNYRFGAPVEITGLALHEGARGAAGPVTLDAGVAAFTDSDGGGNLTRSVGSVSGSLAQALLENPRGYYVELTTSDSALRAQLGGFARR